MRGSFLIAELADGAVWELLIELAHTAGLSDYVERFKQAKQTEDLRMRTIKGWLERLTLSNQAEAVR